MPELHRPVRHDVDQRALRRRVRDIDAGVDQREGAEAHQREREQPREGAAKATRFGFGVITGSSVIPNQSPPGSISQIQRLAQQAARSGHAAGGDSCTCP